MKRMIVEVDDLLSLFKKNPERRFSVRGIIRMIGGDRRTINALLKSLIKYEGLMSEGLYNYNVYYLPMKKKK